LEAKLAIIEQDYHAELAANEGDREPIDAKAEARALAAVFDFLRDCKISHTGSLLRILERYLRPKARFQGRRGRRGRRLREAASGRASEAVFYLDVLFGLQRQGGVGATFLSCGVAA
jgi:hypothetical protein